MRDNLLTIVTGRKRVGKSHESIKQLLFYAFMAKHKRKSLIFDINNEFSVYEIDGTPHKIKRLPENELIAYSKSTEGDIRRIVPLKPDGMPMDEQETENLLIKVIWYFRNGNLLIEDLNVIYGDSLPVKFSGLLCNNAHRGCDILLHLQSAARLVPKMRQNCNILRVHHQLDDMDDSKGKLAGDYKILKIAQLMVNRQVREGNVRFFCYVYRDDGQIKGAFSPKMLAQAIEDFILENPSELQPILQRRDKAGKKIYTYEEALKVKVHEMYHIFNGNVTAPGPKPEVKKAVKQSPQDAKKQGQSNENNQ